MGQEMKLLITYHYQEIVSEICYPPEKTISLSERQQLENLWNQSNNDICIPILSIKYYSQD